MNVVVKQQIERSVRNIMKSVRGCLERKELAKQEGVKIRSVDIMKEASALNV